MLLHIFTAYQNHNLFTLTDDDENAEQKKKKGKGES